MLIAPSILSKLDDLSKTIDLLNNLSIDAIHMDVMDGKFVTNQTFDEKLIKTIKTNKVIDTHLMIVDPLNVVDKYLACSDIVTFHLEAVNNDELLAFLNNKPNDKKIGLAIKPNTDVSSLVPYLKYLDLVLVMSVEPGKGGQTFMPSALTKISYLKDYKEKHQLNYLIEVDGGINNENVKSIALSGADMIVVGTYFFKEEDYDKTIKALSV